MIFLANNHAQTQINTHRSVACGRWFAVIPVLLLLATACVPAQVEPKNSAPKTPLTELLDQTTIWASDNQPAYARVTREVQSRLRNTASVYTGPASGPGGVLNAIQESDRRLVVAIGLEAALAATRLKNKQVVYCQVFNTDSAALARPWVRGVAAIPPVGAQFRAWKALDSKLKRVAVITGPGLDRFVGQARMAARPLGIEITHAVAGTDKELLYAYRKVAGKVQALWLVPDHRILSHDSLRQVLSLSLQRGRHALVFSSELLDLGGLLSVETDPGDIADQVLASLQLVASRGKAPVDNVMPLKRMRVKVNPLVAQQFGLQIPQNFPEYSDGG